MPQDEYGFDRLSTADFERALSMNSSRVTQGQRQMLRIHYGAPNRSITASEMAQAMGWANWTPANLHYGRLGGFLCETFGKHPKQGIFALSTFRRPIGPDDFWHWIMRPPLAEALEKLGWVSQDQDEKGWSAEEIVWPAEFYEGASRPMGKRL